MSQPPSRMNDRLQIKLDRLIAWGWTADREAEYQAVIAERAAAVGAGPDTAPAGEAPAGLAAAIPARVVAQHRGEYRLQTPWGEAVGVSPGRMLYRASGRRELPAVGDWVVVEPARDGPATIVEILPRRTQFVRRQAGREGGEQVVAANVDEAFIMSSLNQELNLRRIERYLVATWESGATPVVVLTKADLADHAEAAVAEVANVAAGVPILVISSVTGDGLDAVRGRLGAGRTVVLVGSSGVGKSTLVNTLAGEELLATKEIRDDDDRGRHTTTHREIFRLPSGALLLDTPGMRELGLIEAEEGLEETFDDVAELAAGCKFRDCTHGSEPGCAVRAAIEAGTLPAERWASYEKLQKETAYEERRQDRSAALAEKKRWKQIQKDYRKRPKK